MMDSQQSSALPCSTRIRLQANVVPQAGSMLPYAGRPEFPAPPTSPSLTKAGEGRIMAEMANHFRRVEK
jgi:hypothetical protein